MDMCLHCIIVSAIIGLQQLSLELYGRWRSDSTPPTSNVEKIISSDSVHRRT